MDDDDVITFDMNKVTLAGTSVKVLSATSVG